MTAAKDACFDAVAAVVCNQHDQDMFVSNGVVYGRVLTASIVKGFVGG